jgi:hypothetical protein
VVVNSSKNGIALILIDHMSMVLKNNVKKYCVTNISLKVQRVR